VVGFNDRSTGRLAGIDPRLTEILNRARTLSGINFEISEGMRNANRQAELVASGASQTQNSRHLTGNATDIFIPDGSGGVNWDFEAYRPIADAAKLAAKELGYNDFQWGGDWESLRDGVHFQVGRSGSTPAMQGRTSTRGSQPMTPTQQAPQGILEMMGIQKRDPSAQDQTALPFYQRDQFKNTMGNIAIAANTLRQRPDDNITAQVQSNRQQRDIEQRSSKTAQWLSQQPGGQTFVEMLNAGADPAAVLQAYQKAVSTKPDQTAAMQNYAEYQRILAAEGPEAAKEFLAMSRSGNSIQIGGDPVALDAGLRTSLYENLGEEFAAYTTAGSSAAASIADLNILQELASMAPEGQIPGRIAQAFPGLNDISAVRDSIIKRVAPTLRVEGSGSTSDIEYAGMIQSLGSLTNSREANQAIISVMQAKAQYNIARAAIVRKLTLGGDYNTERALADIDALEKQQNIPSQVRNIFAMAGVDQSSPQGGGQRLRYNPTTGEFTNGG
jgi:peptidoglycan LD-endopeptidase CwlK